MGSHRQRVVQRQWMRMFILLALAAVLVACGGSSEEIPTPGGYGLADLIQDLQAMGSTAALTRELVDHGFAVQGQRLAVDGRPVFVYEFPTVAEADDAFTGVSADTYSLTVTRSDGDVTIETHGDWLETPHLYRKGRLILISGDDPGLLVTLDRVMGAQRPSPEPRDCSLANAFPPEEAALIWPTLHEVQPSRAAPGGEIEIRGTGGFLYWDNACGEFRNESARDFALLFDGRPAGSITCYAHTCLATLTLPADVPPGTYTIAVEGGSSLEVEVLRP
jgi:hypothetical protein